MVDTSKELMDLKREVVESRNQVIKTDNQIKNLSFDIKSFEKRFDALEGRVRLSSVGVNLIVAGTIALCATMVLGVRSRAYEAEIAGLKLTVRQEHQEAQSKNDELSVRLADMQKRTDNQAQAATLALGVLKQLDERHDKEASEQLDRLDINHLTELERHTCAKRFEELRQRQAEAAYRVARRATVVGQFRAAVPELRRTLSLAPQGRYADAARYHLGWSLWTTQEWAEAEPYVRALMRDKDQAIAEEGRYLLATTLAHLDRRDEARSLLQQIVAAEARFVGGARAYLAAIASDTPLPQDLPGGRVGSSGAHRPQLRLRPPPSRQRLPQSQSKQGPQHPYPDNFRHQGPGCRALACS